MIAHEGQSPEGAIVTAEACTQYHTQAHVLTDLLHGRLWDKDEGAHPIVFHGYIPQQL